MPHRRCGKLDRRHRRRRRTRAARHRARSAAANGVDDLRWLERPRRRARSSRRCAATPRCCRPRPASSTATRLMLAYQGDAEDARRRARVRMRRSSAAGVAADGIVLRGRRRRADAARGRHASSTPPACTRRRWRARIDGLDAGAACRRALSQGQLLRARRAARRSAPDLSGARARRARRAPDARPRRPGALRPRRRVARRRSHAIDYAVDPARADGFYAAIRRYWPALQDGALAAGATPASGRSSRPGRRRPRDFVIQGPADARRAGLVNLFGIESPGLTAAWRSPTRRCASSQSRVDRRQRQP